MNENEKEEKVSSMPNIPHSPNTASTNGLSPDLVLNSDDPGDEVLQRFRYQITYAAILTFYMADNVDDIKEVFCEQHEDILVKLIDESFVGIQVKTRDINLHPFSLDDDAIFNCLKKFVLLNKIFPGKFKTFSIVSNHGFDTTKSAVCIETLIGLAKENKDITGRKNKSLIKKLINACSCEEHCVLETLAKIRTKTFCSLNEIHFKLINQIKICSELNGLTESKIEEIADTIIGKHFKASSLYVDDEGIYQKYILGAATEDDESDKIIQSKRFERDDFLQWLKREKANPVKLLLKDRQSITSSVETHNRLELKMDAGGIDSDNIELMRSFKFSFEQHAASWLYKDTVDVANAKYSQVLMVIQNLCKEVYDEQSIESKADGGKQMLIDVRSRIKSRLEKEPSIFLDCSYEHIVGIVGVLAENCKIWFSPKFEISK